MKETQVNNLTLLACIITVYDRIVISLDNTISIVILDHSTK